LLSSGKICNYMLVLCHTKLSIKHTAYRHIAVKCRIKTILNILFQKYIAQERKHRAT